MATPAERAAESFKQPFTPQPIAGNGPDIDSALRIANALEYSAAQLGSIARTLEQIEARLKRDDDHAQEKKRIELSQRRAGC